MKYDKIYLRSKSLLKRKKKYSKTKKFNFNLIFSLIRKHFHKKKIIDNQIKLLKGISLKRLANFTSQSLNKVYEDFKREQKINKLKRIKLEKREKAKQVKKIRKEERKRRQKITFILVYSCSLAKSLKDTLERRINNGRYL